MKAASNPIQDRRRLNAIAVKFFAESFDLKARIVRRTQCQALDPISNKWVAVDSNSDVYKLLPQ